MTKSILSLSIEKQYLQQRLIWKYAFYLQSPDAALPQVFDKTKDQKIVRKDMKELWNSVLDLLVYSKSPIEWNSGPETQNTSPYIRHLPF